MTTTFDQIVSRVRQQIMGYSMEQAALSELTADMTATDTTFSADGSTVTNLGRGLVEIDDELIWVKSYDRTSGVVTVLGGPNGRGAEGTTAAAHSTNAIVTSSPRYPRARIKEAINDTIRGIYPHLVVFSTTEITRLAPVYEYGLPADCDDVWYVTGQLVGPSKIWQPLPNWRFNPKADPSVFPTGKSIQQLDYVTPGRAVRIVYAKAPSTLAAGSDDFATVTGFPERIVDLVVYGSLVRLFGASDAARIQTLAVESTNRGPMVPPGSALKTAQWYEALYQQRLEEERSLMFGEVPNFQAFQGS